ncbi:GNAT family N-acetyltransferase [Lactobacillus sp. CBA3605]|uniref:GNAT family N-acetyltransferase n=1 Tax=Lactobacillus sp. CBA3605 TaxID=2099788 RepID=UPI000CFC72AF|nr:GNAT family N-acetyltransferase [Lactobacillus sp. CBA3605]AVK61418.1 GNAT family N-acetyltransferase [Lactobacillus sp. CBA3605]
MSKFEKYHPLLTPHYTFDWLTKVRVKSVFTLYQQMSDTQTPPTMLTTADQLNQTMREIFHDQKLVWGISTRPTDQFVGQAGFDPIDLTTKTAVLTVTVLSAHHQTAVLTEIYQRLIAFAWHELHLTHLTVVPAADDIITRHLLVQLDFVPKTPAARAYELKN